ncbi:MAG: DUF4296 domain-containing protein [Nonlabens sp.]|nr:DUF4296 domain-containing protein [Nonlabens sp.]MDP5099873.1 DUF4296 domain-containing protein [Nonlabens sp.]
MRNIAVILTLLFIVSCNQVKYAPKPSPFLDMDEMTAIMTDVYLLDSSFATNQRAYLETGVLPHKFIYEKHNTDSLTFKKNFSYYVDRPEEYREILDRVKKQLDQQKTELQEIMEIEAKERAIVPASDSLLDAQPIIIDSPQ